MLAKYELKRTGIEYNEEIRKYRVFIILTEIGKTEEIKKTVLWFKDPPNADLAEFAISKAFEEFYEIKFDR